MTCKCKDSEKMKKFKITLEWRHDPQYCWTWEAHTTNGIWGRGVEPEDALVNLRNILLGSE